MLRAGTLIAAAAAAESAFLPPAASPHAPKVPAMQQSSPMSTWERAPAFEPWETLETARVGQDSAEEAYTGWGVLGASVASILAYATYRKQGTPSALEVELQPAAFIVDPSGPNASEQFDPLNLREDPRMSPAVFA